MRMRAIAACGVLIVLAAFFASGCGKARTESMPPGASKAEGVETKTDWRSAEPSPAADASAGRGLAEEERLRKEREQLLADLGIPIFFAYDSFELSAEAKGILKAKAEVLKRNPAVKLIVEGHCDERGTAAYNLALGQKRAKSAYDYLTTVGVEAGRLSMVSYGAERPLDPGHDEAAWAKNRRDGFSVPGGK